MLGFISKIKKGFDKVNDILNVSPEEKRKQEIELRKLDLEDRRIDLERDQGQIEVNKLDAQSSFKFQAYARPFILYVCGFSLAYHFIIFSLLEWIFALVSPGLTPPVLSSIDSLQTILRGLLGLGGMRTAEKLKGRHRH